MIFMTKSNVNFGLIVLDFCSCSQRCKDNLACVDSKCVDPCTGFCGNGAHCNVTNHEPQCSCPAGFTGNPHVSCQPIKPAIPKTGNVIQYQK